MKLFDEVKLPEVKIEDKYKFTFQSPLAREVLKDIVLRTCRYGSTLDPESREQIAQHNVAVDILSMCGIFPHQLFDRWLKTDDEAGVNTNVVVVKYKFLRKVLVMLGFGKKLSR
jgi:hypothetical protein